MKRIIVALMAFSLVLPTFSFADPLPAREAGSSQQAASSSSTQPTSSEPRAPLSQRQQTRRNRSYARETRAQRHTGISKGEKVFLVSIVGTSMGIGALAGGPKGLAIGAIVGGWGAYAGHRLWHWIK